jgi:hypothetical protein
MLDSGSLVPLVSQVYICELFLLATGVQSTQLPSSHPFFDLTMGLYLILPLTLLAIVLVIGIAGFAQILHAQ